MKKKKKNKRENNKPEYDMQKESFQLKIFNTIIEDSTYLLLSTFEK